MMKMMLMAYLSSLIYVISRKLQKFGQFLSRALPTYYDYKDEDEDVDAYRIDDIDDGTFTKLSFASVNFLCNI